VSHKHVTPDDLVRTAYDWLGWPYVWGGAVGVDGKSGTDCSGMCNNWFGRIWKLAIPDFPAGAYTGAEHGPSTVGWLDSVGDIVNVVPRSDAMGSDIACWQTHMGMCVDNQDFISAANPAQGTIKAPIDGFIPGETLYILRVKNLAPGGSPLPISLIRGTKQIDTQIQQTAKGLKELVWHRMRVRNVATRVR
jgi:cell wall-associated NlpC family hydrolase